MTTDDALLLKSTPELLDTWIGPLRIRWLREIDRECADDNGTEPAVALGGPDTLVTLIWCESMREPFSVGEVADQCTIWLDLSREECRDRVGRCYRRRYARAVCTAPGPMQLYRGSDGNGRIVNWFGQHHSNHVPDLADLDPNDDTRLPDGSFRVHALGLLYVARKLLAS